MTRIAFTLAVLTAVVAPTAAFAAPATPPAKQNYCEGTVIVTPDVVIVEEFRVYFSDGSY